MFPPGTRLAWGPARPRLARSPSITVGILPRKPWIRPDLRVCSGLVPTPRPQPRLLPRHLALEAAWPGAECQSLQKGLTRAKTTPMRGQNSQTIAKRPQKRPDSAVWTPPKRPKTALISNTEQTAASHKPAIAVHRVRFLARRRWLGEAAGAASPKAPSFKRLQGRT